MDTDSNSTVWDTFAFAYSRYDMARDALFVIAKMKDFNILPSIVTCNSLLYNLRHSDIMWDIHNEIKSFCGKVQQLLECDVQEI